MEISDLDGKRVILKSLVRSPAGSLIGTREEVGRVVIEADESITIRIDEGKNKGEMKHVPVEEIYVSEPEHESYVLGGTGPWERTTDFVKVDDADFIIEWEIVHSDNVAFDRLKGTQPVSYKKKSVLAALKKDADVFGIAEASRYVEEAEDEIKAEQQVETEIDLTGPYKVMRFDSVKSYSGLTPAIREIFLSEVDAHEAMRNTAKQFVSGVKRDGFLIDIKRLSDNSLRVEYVDRNGGEAYVIFQVFREKEAVAVG